MVADIAAGRAGLPRDPKGVPSLSVLAEKWLARRELPALTWYQATRHTFASQFVLAGGSIEKLSKLMGHSRVTTTERYAHPGRTSSAWRTTIAWPST